MKRRWEEGARGRWEEGAKEHPVIRGYFVVDVKWWMYVSAILCVCVCVCVCGHSEGLGPQKITVFFCSYPCE